MDRSPAGGGDAGLWLSIRVGSRREWIDPVQFLSERVFALAGLDEETAYWPILAVREAVMNAVLHGNSEHPELSVKVDYRIVADRIEVSVYDEGEGFEPTELSNPLSAENLLQEGGRGIYLMRQLMDEVNFLFPESGGTCIQMVKRLSNGAQD